MGFHRTANGTVMVAVVTIAMALCASDRAVAQVIQLPTFSSVRVSTSVVVPDSGAGIARQIQRRTGSMLGRYGRTPRAGAVAVRRQTAPTTPRSTSPRVAPAAAPPRSPAFGGRDANAVARFVAEEQRRTARLVARSDRQTPR